MRRTGRRKKLPAEYTHQLICERVYAGLPERIRQKIRVRSAYFWGAQGADVMYFLRMKKKPNYGYFLHNRDVYEVFCSFCERAEDKDPDAISYMAGYITHYAADCVFHPYVYALTARLAGQEPQRRIRWHAYIESDLDTYFVESRAKTEVGKYQNPMRGERVDLTKIAPLLREVCRARGLQDFSERALRRAVWGYLLFERAFTDRKYRKRTLVSGVERVLHLPQVCSVLFRRRQIDARVKNSDRQTWSNLSDDQFLSEENADDLFERAVREGIRLLCAFFDAAENKTPLLREDFGRGYLSGIDSRLPFVRPSRPSKKNP